MRRAIGWAVLVVLALLAGCTPAVPRPPVTFAVVAGAYYSADGKVAVDAAVVEDSERLLRRVVQDINSRKGVDMVLVAGDLLARADPLSLDRARAILDELRPSYYIVLGEHDGPALRAKGEAAPEAAPPAATAPSAPGPGPRGESRSTVIWAFQGHGFTGAEGYWVCEAKPGVVIVGLDTVSPGRRAGHIDAQQLAWLERALSAHAGKMVIVVAHHGLIPMHPLDEGAAWAHLMVDNAAEVRAVLEKHANVVMVVTASHHFAGSRVSGRIVYLSSPSVSVWPLAYHLVRVDRENAEAVWVPLAPEWLARQAQDRLLASPAYRGVFAAGEDGDTACVRLFGGNKLQVVPLPGIRP